MFATNIYNANNYNIRLVQEILQHSDPAITQRYLSIAPEDVENALAGTVNII
jgi:site-specific recombinase XerD